MLIPVPGSSPRVEGALWAPERICRTLVALGLGASIETPLSRVVAAPEAAYASPGERPSLDLHYESMRCAPGFIQPARIVLVDDVVTKGRTLLAAARRLREAFANSEIKAFALIRYLGLAPDIESFKAPIKWRH